jgi:hypothetical protein
MSHSADYEDEGLVGYYKTGHEDGVQAERQRILEALRAKAATRTIFETLEQPFYIDDLIRTIMEGQDE